MTSPRAHWDEIWRDRDPASTSWFQSDPEPCLTTVRNLTAPGDHVIVVGAGRTPLVAPLVAEGRRITAIDISPTAVEQLVDDLRADGIAAACSLAEELDAAPKPGEVIGLVADVRALPALPPAEAWHDRAVFHFVTAPAGQRAYAHSAAATVRPGGHLVLAEFAPDGPEQCSGLPVARLSEEELAALMRPHFLVVDATRHDHVTPWGAEQHFLHVVLRRSSSR